MKKNLRWKVVLVVAVIALCSYLAYPPSEKIHYGLDLQGGMHLVLQVMTDDAINYETDQAVLSLREELQKENITYTSVSKLEGQIGEFTIQEFDPEKEREVEDMLDGYFRDWNYTVRNGSFFVSLKSGSDFYMRNQSVQQALETLGNRVNELGLTEPTIQRQGLSGDRIIVELPGVEDPDRVKDILKTTALLEFRLVKGGPEIDRETLLASYGGVVPEDMEVMRGDPEHTEGGWYLVSNVSEITGNDLRNARRSQDEWNKPAVSFTLHPDPGKRFEKMTADNVGKPMSIVLDKKLMEVANIRERIPATSSTMIHGNFTIEEADTLSMMLRAGAMPASVKYLEDRTIGPSLGADSIRRGLTSILMALVLVMIFMVFYYRLAGLNAVLGLFRRQPDAARHRRHHLDRGYGSGRQRPGVRAHPGGTGPGEERAELHILRIFPRVPDHPGRQCHHHHRGHLPLPVRYRPHPGICRYPDHRYLSQHVHRHLRVEADLRSYILQAQKSRKVEYLKCSS